MTATVYTVVARHAKPGFSRVYPKPTFRRSKPVSLSVRLGLNVGLPQANSEGEGKLRVPPFNVSAGKKPRAA